jgi:predicted TIM-barrel fold metal-dependent hydrolase
VALALLACAGWATADHASAAQLLPMPFPIDSATSPSDRPARPFGKSYRGPIFDTHTHLDPDEKHDVADPSAVTAGLKMADVRRLVLLPTPNAGRTVGISLALSHMQLLRRNSNGQVTVLCGSDYLTEWMNSALFGRSAAEIDRQMARLASDLKKGSCDGVGEIGFRHYDKSRVGAQLLINVPAGYPPLLAIADTAARTGVPLDLHAEPVEPDGTRHEAEVFGTIALMFERNPNLQLILSHTAMTNIRNARALLTAFPSLMMNINFAKHRHGMWRNLEAVSDAEGRLYSDWSALFEEMPDRFMVGSDMFFSRVSGPDEEYQRRIRHIRRSLGSLAPDAARRIAYENAERFFGPLP